MPDQTQGALTIQDFTRDWHGQLATGPAGHTSQSWTANHNQKRTVMRMRLSTTHGKPCALKPHLAVPARSGSPKPTCNTCSLPPP